MFWYTSNELSRTNYLEGSEFGGPQLQTTAEILEETRVIVAAAQTRLGANMSRILMSSWSPPISLKDSNRLSGRNDGFHDTLKKNGAYHQSIASSRLVFSRAKNPTLTFKHPVHLCLLFQCRKWPVHVCRVRQVLGRQPSQLSSAWSQPNLDIHSGMVKAMPLRICYNIHSFF